MLGIARQQGLSARIDPDRDTNIHADTYTDASSDADSNCDPNGHAGQLLC